MTTTHPDIASVPPDAWQRLGGTEKVAALIEEFVLRMRRDVMIGFFFRRVRPERLAQLELQHLSGHMGGPLAYEGRPLAEAHRHLRLGRGHYLRRRTLLAEVLEGHAVPQDIAQAWLSAQDRLSVLVLGPPEKTACPTR